MDVEQLERQLRKQVGERLGRPLSDQEWEAFKRAQLRAGGGASPAPTTVGGPQWTATGIAACLAAVIALLAGIGFLIRADVMFSPWIRIPLGVCAWLIVLIVLRWWLAGFFAPPHGFWQFLGWLGWGFVFGVFIVAPFAWGGGALLFEGQDYLTDTRTWIDDQYPLTGPVGLLGWGFILVAIVLGWIGIPERPERT